MSFIRRSGANIDCLYDPLQAAKSQEFDPPNIRLFTAAFSLIMTSHKFDVSNGYS